jgi:hypothetical protein
MQPDLHDPRIDLTSAAGRAILELFTTIKQRVEQDDGNWPGAEVVDVLSEWLRGIGFDPDGPAHTLPGRESVMGWPDLPLDESRIRTWLTGEADLDELGIADDPAYPLLGIDGGGFLAHVEHLVTAASDAGLFGGDVDVAVAISADSAGVMDGAYVFVSFRTGARVGCEGWARLASLHLEHRALIDEDALTGVDAAVSILLAVTTEARHVLTEAGRLLGFGDVPGDGGR